MPIDWDNFESDLNDAIDDSVTITDAKLAAKVSSVTRMTDEEISEFFPEPADLQRLTKLMKIVKSAEDQNTKVNKIVENTEEFADIIVTLLNKFV